MAESTLNPASLPIFFKLFGIGREVSIPSGYLSYSAKDFEDRWHIARRQSVQILNDYLSLIQFNKGSEFWISVFSSRPDQKRLAAALTARYKLVRSQAGSVALFFANIVSARANQTRCSELGISLCTWEVSSCGREKGDPNASHLRLEGMVFKVGAGMPVGDNYALPGVAIGCTCTAAFVIPGFEYYAYKRALTKMT